MNESLKYLALTGVMFIWSACMTEKIDEQTPGLSESPEELIDGVFLLENDEIAAFLRQNPSNQNRLIAQIRQATVKYHDFDAAVADKYMLDHCVEHPQLGGMGHHAVNLKLLEEGYDPLKPTVLLYEPLKNGKLKLVGVEYIIPSSPLFEGDIDELEPPTLGDVPFDNHRWGKMIQVLDEFGEPLLDDNDDPIMMFQPDRGGPPMPHYQLHVWIWKANPSGMYFPFNPNVSCQHAQEDDH
jgi:hypothetical protein